MLLLSLAVHVGCTSGSVTLSPDSEVAESAPIPDDSVEQLPSGGGCLPGADPVFVTEGELVQLAPRCLGEPLSGTLSITNLPTGATWVNGELVWLPGVDQAGRYDLSLRFDGGDWIEAGTATIWVADAWDHPENVPVDPLLYQEELGLPVVHLSAPPDLNASYEVASTMVYRGHTFNIEVKYRGASSLYYPKIGYTIDFPPDDEFEDEAIGFPKRRSVVLTTLFDDNSYIRQRLCYDLWNALDPSRHAIETHHVALYVNGAYWGLYLLGDHIDGEYWEDQGYREDGNLYKAISHEANFYADYYGYPKSSLHAGYEKKSGTPAEGEAGAFDDLDALVSFVINADEATFRDTLSDQIAVDEFMDWWILVRFTEADDSGGKNSYLYNDPLSPMWHFAPWDFNHSLGQTWLTERESALTNWDFTSANNLFRRILEDPSLNATLVDRYQRALSGPMDNATLQAQIDTYMAEIGPSAARDWARWGGAYYSYGSWYWRSDFTSHEGEVAYVREWLSTRAAFMAELYP